MDHYTDTGHLFAKIFFKRELPEFVKTGSMYDNLNELPDQSFADSANRLFPVMDAANTYTSYAYAYFNRDVPEIAAVLPRLQKAAALFEISQHLPELEKHIDQLLAPNPKTASAQKSAAFEIPVNTMQVKTINGIGADNLKRAAARFLEILSDVPFSDRTKAAAAIVASAAEHEITIDPEIQKVAGLAQCDEDIFQTQTALRLNLIPDFLDKRAAVRTLDVPLTNLPGRLSALQKVDQQFKLAKFYGKPLLDPHRSVFNSFPAEKALLKIGSLSYPAELSGDDKFVLAAEAAFGKEKATSLLGAVSLQESLDGLSEHESAVLNAYLA